MSTSKPFFVAAGVSLWLPVVLSFIGATSLARLPGVALSQVPLIALLVACTLLLGMLIGRRG